jgi:hypothetical protein
MCAGCGNGFALAADLSALAGFLQLTNSSCRPKMASKKGSLMAWTWARRVFEKHVTGVMKVPQLYAYGLAFWAFLAGFWVQEAIWKSRNHSARAFDYVNGPLYILVVLFNCYCVVRAVQRLRPNPAINFILEWIEDFQHQRSSVPSLVRSLDSILHGNLSLSPELRAVVLEAANELKATQNAAGADTRPAPEEIVGRLRSVLAISRGTC